MKPFLPIRAWVPELNLMDYSPTLVDGKYCAGGNDCPASVDDTAILMLGLPLPNQNHIIIYEDDVLESTFTDWDEDGRDFKIERASVVLFTNGGFYADEQGHGRDELIDWDLGNYPFRILGNIHQNPELKKLFPERSF